MQANSLGFGLGKPRISLAYPIGNIADRISAASLAFPATEWII
jgi:hypothetical protein